MKEDLRNRKADLLKSKGLGFKRILSDVYFYGSNLFHSINTKSNARNKKYKSLRSNSRGEKAKHTSSHLHSSSHFQDYSHHPSRVFAYNPQQLEDNRVRNKTVLSLFNKQTQIDPRLQKYPLPMTSQPTPKVTT